MQNVEDLETVVLTKGAGLPDVLIDVETSDGDTADLSADYDSFSADFFDEDGDVILTCDAEGTTSGFRVLFDLDDLAGIPANTYLLRARCERTADGKARFGKCLAVVLTR